MCSQCSTICVEFNKTRFSILWFLFDLLWILQVLAILNKIIKLAKKKMNHGCIRPRRSRQASPTTKPRPQAAQGQPRWCAWPATLRRPAAHADARPWLASDGEAMDVSLRIFRRFGLPLPEACRPSCAPFPIRGQWLQGQDQCLTAPWPAPGQGAACRQTSSAPAADSGAIPMSAMAFISRWIE